jgi:hypothetical protein
MFKKYFKKREERRLKALLIRLLNGEIDLLEIPERIRMRSRVWYIYAQRAYRYGIGYFNPLWVLKRDVALAKHYLPEDVREQHLTELQLYLPQGGELTDKRLGITDEDIEPMAEFEATCKVENEIRRRAGRRPLAQYVSGLSN